jgi:cell division control protein 45
VRASSLHLTTKVQTVEIVHTLPPHDFAVEPSNASLDTFSIMYLPRDLISKLYTHLQRTRHPLSPPVLILVALEPDALCACRILTRLLKHDYIPHKIHPVAGYGDLERAGQELVAPMMETRGGSGGVVICLGVGGMVDMGTILGLEVEGEESSFNGVEVWVIDSHRPWNLGNVFGGFPLEPVSDVATSYQSRAPLGVTLGRIQRSYKPGKGGIMVFDDGDIEEGLDAERDAYLALVDMPDVEDDGEAYDDGNSESEQELEQEDEVRPGQKRKSWSDRDETSEDDDDRPRQRRRSNSVRFSGAHFSLGVLTNSSVHPDSRFTTPTSTTRFSLATKSCNIFRRCRRSAVRSTTS